MIVYFSGTGNSKFCAEALAFGLQDDLLDAGHYMKHQIAADLISGKPWVFVSPTYAWQVPEIFSDFIQSGCFGGHQDAYFVMTCGADIGNAGEYLEKLCQDKALRYRDVHPVVMPENYIAMFDVPSQAEADGIVRAAKPVLDRIVSFIASGKDFPVCTVSAKDKLKSSTIHDFFYKKYVKAKGFYSTDSCISCGACAERCVLQNITLEQGRPVWGGNCTHCMACICGCPTAAIEYGKKSLGKPRYWCCDYTP